MTEFLSAPTITNATPAQNASSQEEIGIAYRYVESLNGKDVGHRWNGWSVREAFLAGRKSAAPQQRTCHVCGKQVIPPDQSVRFLACECHIEIVRLRQEAKLWKQAYGEHGSDRTGKMLAVVDAAKALRAATKARLALGTLPTGVVWNEQHHDAAMAEGRAVGLLIDSLTALEATP